MTVITYQSSAYCFRVTDISETIICPGCGAGMHVENVYSRKKRQKEQYEGATATCTNGCKDLSSPGRPTSLMFFSYDPETLKQKVDKFYKK